MQNSKNFTLSLQQLQHIVYNINIVNMTHITQKISVVHNSDSDESADSASSRVYSP